MSPKQAKKRIDKKCFFCLVDDYSLLDLHRILPGEQGGSYHRNNTLTVCANHHREIHSGKIKIDKKYPCTNGKHILHCWIEEKEEWLEC